MHTLVLRFAFLCALCSHVVAADAPPVTKIAADGKALLPVIISTSASVETKARAAELADYLGRISGAKFAVRTGDGSTGIVVGLGADFPKLATEPALTGKAITERENYLLRSHRGGVLVLGNTAAGVSHAVWDLLHRLGHRQFFPGPTWEVIPQRAALAVSVDALERPSYHSRSIWYGWGALPGRDASYEQWTVRNRATRGIVLMTGHAYEKILKEHAAEFAAHPEYLALVNGKRQGKKFCTANAGLRALVVRHVLALLDADPALDSVSCEPSDGGGWCECAECEKLGSISDRALFLTNEAARAVQVKYPGKLVGQLAYSFHSPVPRLRAEPGVVVSVATGFMQGGLTLDEMIDGWSGRAKTLGIREYLGLQSWHHDLPGQQRGAQLGYLARSIPHFHAKGARFYSAESSDNWGPCGLGYYAAARMLWDVREAQNLEAIFEDFIVSCFKDSQQPMRKFYQLINRSTPPASDDLVGRMYRLLREARSLARDDAERTRLNDLVLYTRHVELWLDYTAAAGTARQAGIEAVLRHSSRIASLGMVHTLAVWQERWRGHDKDVKLPEEYRYRARGENPWRSTEPFTASELDSLIKQGIMHRAVTEFEPVNFSRDLVPATALALKDRARGNFGTMQRGTRNYWTWIETAPATIELTVTAGLVYKNKGPAKIALHPQVEPEGRAVAQVNVPPDQQAHSLKLRTTFTGLHRIEVAEGRIGTRVESPAGRAFTVAYEFEEAADAAGRHDLYFYVPRGTKLVGGFAKGPGRMLSGSGAAVHQFREAPGYFSVIVQPGEDGQLWQFANTGGQRVLLTVPPFLARSAAELLLPREVIEKDSQAAALRPPDKQ